MKITKQAISNQSPDLEMVADGGDQLPDAIILFHNERKFEYRVYSETTYYPGEFKKK